MHFFNLYILPLIWTPAPLPDSEISYFKSLVNYTASSNCVPGLDIWNCTTCTGSTIGTDQVTIVGGSEKDSFGYVAVNEHQRRIIVSFRGSTSINDWVHDLQFIRTSSGVANAPAGASVHGGFLKAWKTISVGILSQLTVLINKYPDYAILVTGHSLGGAIGVLCSMQLLSTGIVPVSKLELFTVNQPRVGNSVWNSWVESFIARGMRYIRVTNMNDLVSHLPFSSWGFLHSGTEVWITSGKTLVCKSEESDCANSAYWYTTSRHGEAWGMLVGGKSCDK